MKKDILRVAQIPYINSLPFYWPLKRKVKHQLKSGMELCWIKATPREMGELARKNAIDAAPLSLLDAISLEPRFEPLWDLGISVKEAAGSVLLFSKCSAQNLSGRTVRITTDTVTSVQLLKCILEFRFSVRPRYFYGRTHAQAEAVLLIGDQALKAKNNSEWIKKYPHMLDLGEAWKRWQNLPFVFARWMIRSELSKQTKVELYDWLLQNIRRFSINDQSVPAQGFCERKGQFSINNYLALFNYNLGKEELKAISRFHKLASSLPRGENI